MPDTRYLESALELVFGDADDDDEAVAEFVSKYSAPAERHFASQVRDEWVGLLGRNDPAEALRLARAALHSDVFADGNEALAWLRVHYHRLSPLWEKLAGG
jgi:hypothetical protein